jgi:peptidoglycan/xylan/chitin deacetylase (PgdA/CDA1 family)
MISILLYHQIARISAECDPRGLDIPPKSFENHMRYLYRAGFRCLRLEEAAHYLQKNGSQPSKTFVLTFDDGFQDLYYTVMPILNKFGFTATIFLVAGRVGCESNWNGKRGKSSAPLLSWRQARELAQAGFSFGSHTVTHQMLTRLDDKRARHEIVESKKMIEEQLGYEVNFFSYPYSNNDSRIRRIVAESGYAAACGGDRGKWSMFNLWRTQCVNADNRLSFALKARGLYQRFIWMREQSPFGPQLRRIARPLKTAYVKGTKGRKGLIAGNHNSFM